MYLRVNQNHPLRRHLSVAPRQAVGLFDAGNIATLLIGALFGAVGFSMLFGKGSSARSTCPVSDEDWREVNQKYDYRVGTEDYWMDQATKGMSDEDVEDAIDAAGEAGMKRVKKHWRDNEILI